jgi:hypothetical protein
MERAVRAALSENLAMSRRVLWTNDVPSSATHSTRGAALAELRSSAAARRRQAVRVRVVDPNARLLAIQVDPSYAQATATVVNGDRVRIQPRRGAPRVARLNEHAHVELRRVGSNTPPQFVVWRVSLQK